VRGRLYTVLEIRQRDQLYLWLLDWLAAQRAVHENGTRVFAEVHPEFHKAEKTAKQLRVRFFPIDDGSMYGLQFCGAFIWVSHHSVDSGMMTSRKGGGITCSELRLRVTVLGRSKTAATALFQAAFEYNKARLGGRTKIFVAQPHERAEHSHWRRLEPRRNRPLHTIVGSSSPGPEAILADMQTFFNSEAWYAERGIPYRRGYLFHGPPGCGKTSFVTAAAGALDCPIYILNLAEPSLSDLALLKLVTDAPPRSMLLMEDVDAAFNGVLGKGGGTPSEKSQRDGLHMGLLTFSGLLNALDGVAGQEGKLLIMSTNCPDKLDEALVRPGRVDLRAEFHHASRDAIKSIFCNFFADCERICSEELQEAAAMFAAQCEEKSLSMAGIQGHLMQFRDDPWAAAKAIPPNPCNGGGTQRVRQFVVPRGAAAVAGEQEE